MAPRFGYTGSAASDGGAATRIEGGGHRQGSVRNCRSPGSTAPEPLREHSPAGCMSLLTGRERVESNPPWGGSPCWINRDECHDCDPSRRLVGDSCRSCPGKQARQHSIQPVPVLSAFAPTGQTTRCRARLSGLQDAECDRRSAHVTKASRHRRHVLAHAGSDAQEISEFVVLPPAIAPC